LKKNCVMAEFAPALTLFGVVFGVGGDLDVPVGALCLADEGDELGGVAEVARHVRAAGHVAAQRDHAVDVARAVGRQNLLQRVTRATHARQVRRGLEAGIGDRRDGRQRLVARRAAGAVGDAKELRLERAEFLHHALQLLVADRRVGREELETDGNLGCRHGASPCHAAGAVAHTKNSRLPSPPTTVLSK
jgi:hypothetical protein